MLYEIQTNVYTFTSVCDGKGDVVCFKIASRYFFPFGRKFLLTLVNNAHTADKHVTQFGGKIGHRILIHC